MRFKIGDEVAIAKSFFGDLNLVVGRKGIVKWCWDKSEPPKSYARQQPEYDVEIDDKHFIVLEEELQ